MNVPDRGPLGGALAAAPRRRSRPSTMLVASVSLSSMMSCGTTPITEYQSLRAISLMSMPSTSDLALLRLERLERQLEERGLARAGVADEEVHLAALGDEADVRDDRACRRRRSRRRDTRCVPAATSMWPASRVGLLGRLPHEGEGLELRVGAQQPVDRVADHFERPVELHQQRAEQHEVADRDLAGLVARQEDREGDDELDGERAAEHAGKGDAPQRPASSTPRGSPRRRRRSGCPPIRRRRNSAASPSPRPRCRGSRRGLVGLDRLLEEGPRVAVGEEDRDDEDDAVGEDDEDDLEVDRRAEHRERQEDLDDARDDDHREQLDDLVDRAGAAVLRRLDRDRIVLDEEADALLEQPREERWSRRRIAASPRSSSTCTRRRSGAPSQARAAPRSRQSPRGWSRARCPPAACRSAARRCRAPRRR